MSTDNEKEIVLDWTSKQGRILSGGGKATEFYTPARGFPFQEEELPHHHLMHNNTESKFSSWASENQEKNMICGAYSRPLFVGGFEHTTSHDEVVYNVQTNTLFIDIRMPRIGRKLLEGIKGFDDMNNEEIGLFARRHAFGGYTRLEYELDGNNTNRPVCTRHHCIDWNFAGVPRPRPNKWFVEMKSDQSVWKELSYAKDDYGQHYYWEQWERISRDGNGNGLVLAMRKKKTESDDRDGILVAVGDHFNYILGREISNGMKDYLKISAVDTIDAAIKAGDRDTIKTILSIDAGHGLISKGWVIDHSIRQWREGSRLFGSVSVEISDSNSLKVNIDNCAWEVYECNVDHDKLKQILEWDSDDQEGASFPHESVVLGRARNKRDASFL
jgi:hypothetical protein